MNNSIGKEGVTNNKLAEESITNDKIKEESVRRKRVDEDAVKKDEAARSAMSRPLCRVRIRSSRGVNQVPTISPDAESVEYKNLSVVV